MNESLQKSDKGDRAVEFIPFGGETKIRLSISIVKTLIAAKTKSGRTCSDQDAMKFIMLCKAKGLDPFEQDAYLVGYDTTVNGVVIPTYTQITAHQALLKRAEVHAEYKGMDSGIVVRNENGQQEERKACFILDEEELLGGWATVHRMSKMPVYSKLSLAQRKPTYETQFWKGAKAAEQIQKCAEADALRLAFPSKIGGLFLREEMDFPINVEAHAVELPTHRLVDVTPADSEPQTETAQSEPQQEQHREPAPAKSARADLAQFVVSEGFSFDDFQRWAMESNNVPGADSLTTFDEVPEADAKRIMRSKDGLKKGLALAKGTQ